MLGSNQRLLPCEGSALPRATIVESFLLTDSSSEGWL
jgi:hypothetical protein